MEDNEHTEPETGGHHISFSRISEEKYPSHEYAALNIHFLSFLYIWMVIYPTEQGDYRKYLLLI